MKKITVFILTALLLLSLIGCDGSAPPPSGDINDLSEYLDTMGFTPSMWQGTLFDLAESLMYEGKNIHDAAPGCFYDGKYGGGYRSQGSRFGFANDYTRSEDGASATSYNYLYTHVPLEGLDLPLGITFDDNLSTLMYSMGLDPDIRFDIDATGVTTLHDDGTACLTLTDFAKKPDTPENNKFTFNLNYTETYEVTLTDGRIADVTRTLSMSFSGSEDTLSFISMSVQMKYPLNQG